MSFATFPRLPWGRPHSESLAVHGVTAGVWAAAAAVIVYWAIHLGGGSESVSVAVALAAPPMADAGSIARMLGAVPATVQRQPVAQTKATLLGVVAQDDADEQSGVALISLNGGTAQPYRVGVEVADGYRLAAMDTQAARLSAPNRPDWLLEMSKKYASSSVPAPVRPGIVRVPTALKPNAKP